MIQHLKKNIKPNAIITKACNGEESLDIVAKQQFDIIVADQYIEDSGGVMVGTETVVEMRKMGIDSIIIECSGNDTDEIFKEAGTKCVWRKKMPPNEKILKQL